MDGEQELKAEVIAEGIEPEQIQLSIDRFTALTVIGNIQLALRHPGNTGAARPIAIEFIRRLAEKLPPAMRESVEDGFDPAWDREAVNE